MNSCFHRLMATTVATLLVFLIVSWPVESGKFNGIDDTKDYYPKTYSERRSDFQPLNYGRHHYGRGELKDEDYHEEIGKL